MRGSSTTSESVAGIYYSDALQRIESSIPGLFGKNTMKNRGMFRFIKFRQSMNKYYKGENIF